jgi:hypothetical protein
VSVTTDPEMLKAPLTATAVEILVAEIATCPEQNPTQPCRPKPHWRDPPTGRGAKDGRRPQSTQNATNQTCDRLHHTETQLWIHRKNHGTRPGRPDTSDAHTEGGIDRLAPADHRALRP